MAIEPPVSVWRAYYYALGKFMHMFAVAESDLNATVSNFVVERVLSKRAEQEDIIRAVLGAQRMQPVKQTLRAS